MQYGILENGTMVISDDITVVNNVKTVFKSKSEYVKAGGIIPETMMTDKEREQHYAELTKRNKVK